MCKFSWKAKVYGVNILRRFKMGISNESCYSFHNGLISTIKIVCWTHVCDATYKIVSYNNWIQKWHLFILMQLLAKDLGTFVKISNAIVWLISMQAGEKKRNNHFGRKKMTLNLCIFPSPLQIVKPSLKIIMHWLKRSLCPKHFCGKPPFLLSFFMYEKSHSYLFILLFIFLSFFLFEPLNVTGDALQFNVSEIWCQPVAAPSVQPIHIHVKVLIFCVPCLCTCRKP